MIGLKNADYGDLKIDAETIQFGTNNGSERMRITADGKVGIGTTSPQKNLQIFHLNYQSYSDLLNKHSIL